MTPLIAAEQEDGALRLTVGDGSRLNALPTPGWGELAARLRQASADEEVRVVVIEGRGGAFCAGSDLREWIGAPVDAVEESFEAMESAFTAIETCPVPVIAKVRGVAAGAGCQLALACDLAYLADSARIGMPIVRLGILTSARFAERMLRAASASVVRELLYTGSLLDGPAAATAGLATRAVPDADLDVLVASQAARIAGLPADAVRAAKQATARALAGAPGAAPAAPQPAVSASEFPRAVREFLSP